MTELTLGPSPSTGSPVRAIVIAAVVMIAVAVGLYFLAHRRLATITVTQEQTFSPHIEDKAIQGGGVNVVGVGGSSEDTLYVVEHLHIANKLSIPLYLTGATAVLTVADGSELEATVVMPIDFPRLEPSFPELTPMLTHALTMSDTVAAKGSLDGAVLLAFPGETTADWKSKHGATLTLMLANQDPQTISLP